MLCPMRKSPKLSSHITPEILLQAYKIGVFPMAETRDDPDIFWVDPEDRGIFPLDNFHISRSLARHIRRCNWQITTDQDFQGVVQGCADRSETWISPQIFDLYVSLFEMGRAHSLEVYEGESLIGGVYGVAIGGAFFGESMFSRRPNASKTALAYLLHRLKAGGFQLLDTQFLTPHLASLGAVEISRKAYHAQLAKALAVKADFNPKDYSASASSITAASSASGGT